MLGLVRDVLAGAFFGVSAINSAFLFAFTLPNLFRRLLGEGALTSALVPTFSDALTHGGRDEAFRFLNQVLTRAVIALVVLVGLGMVILAAGHLIPDLEERWYLGFDFGIVMMPYMLLVCVAALLAAVLNVLGRFGVAALSQVWINTAMIVSLGGFGYLFARSPIEQMYYQCGGVLVGGLLQVGAPVWALWREGWRPRLTLEHSPRVRETMVLFLPGLLGAAILQINIVTSRLIAFGLNDSAVTVLYLANRLMELPLGMFTIAVATVLFPNLALLAAQGDRAGWAAAYAQGMRMIFAITLPATLGLVVLREPVVGALFQWGVFGAGDVSLTVPIIALFALGLPFYSLATFATRGLHALKDTRTPVRVAFWAFLSNLVLSLLLMRPLGTVGLALANLGTAAFQSIWLQRLLERKQQALSARSYTQPLVQIAGAGAAMTLITWAGWQVFVLAMEVGKVRDTLAVAVLVPAGVAVYFATLWVLKFEDRQQVMDLLLRLLRRRSAR